jgi:hypothetical protein
MFISHHQNVQAHNIRTDNKFLKIGQVHVFGKDRKKIKVISTKKTEKHETCKMLAVTFLSLLPPKNLKTTIHSITILVVALYGYETWESHYKRITA